MLLGVIGNVAPLKKPHDFFVEDVNGGIRTDVEPYKFKKTWSGALFDHAPKGTAVEMITNIQTASFKNHAAAKTASMLYTNGIMYVPDAALLGMDDDTLEKLEPLAIQHKCEISGTYKRTLTMVDRDSKGNSYMQLSDGSLGGENSYMHDI